MTPSVSDHPWAVIQEQVPPAPAALGPDRKTLQAFGVVSGSVTLVVRSVQSNGRLSSPEVLMESGAGHLVVVPPDRADHMVSIRATHDAVWAPLQVGSSEVLSTAEVEPALVSIFQDSVELRNWCARLESPVRWAEFLEALSTELITRMGDAITQAQARINARLLRLKAFDDESLQQAVLSISDAGPPRSDSRPTQSSSQEVQAMLRVIEDLGSLPANHSMPRLQPGVKPVDSVARELHMQYRSVKLEGRWWKESAGPLVTETLEGTVPVALIPRRGGYLAEEYHEDGIRTIDPVSAKTAAAYGDAATMFYRPLPSGSVTLRDLLRLVCIGNVRDIAFIVMMTVVTSVLVALVPLLTGFFIGTVIPNVEHVQLVFVGAMLVSIAVSRALLHVVAGLLFLRVETRSSYQVIAALVDRILQLPTSFFRGSESGDITQRVMAVEQVRSALTQSVLSVLISLFASLSNLGVLFFYDASLGLTAIVVIAIELAIVVWLSIRMARLDYQASVAKGKLDGFGMDVLVGVRQIQLQGACDRVLPRLIDRLGRVGALTYQTGVLGIWLGVTLAATSTIALALVFMEFTAGLRDPASSTVLEAGGFVAFITALVAFLGAVASISPAITAVASMIPQIHRIRPILSAVTEHGESQGEGEGQGRGQAISLHGAVAARGITFSYGPNLPRILDGVDIDAQPGEFIAIVGATGCGKSTLMSILLGLEKPTSGQVLYDSVPMDSLDHAIVRSQVGVVMQSSQTLPGNVQSMILGIGSNKTMEAAWAAARLVGMEDEIDQMPMGMLTMITSTSMSQSQIQRLMIARALVNRPEVLFLDEATSALDNFTQAEITKTIDQLGSTRVVIAHRLSTIRQADRIYVLDQGRVVQSGGFEELAAADGMFKELMAGQVS
ncbi:MAG: hypothetical protein CBC35_00350 [Planctomycetes bacterium TMED75]|nr:hypothetical protein [Planctomycetaceae bacterium]OUU96901.1 MAG: hypothetical protein CBC35_00350 [Planctomycetes bacterium TMED75]